MGSIEVKEEEGRTDGRGLGDAWEEGCSEEEMDAL